MLLPNFLPNQLRQEPLDKYDQLWEQTPNMHYDTPPSSNANDMEITLAYNVIIPSRIPDSLIYRHYTGR